MTQGRKPIATPEMEIIDPAEVQRVENALTDLRATEQEAALVVSQRDAAVRAVALQISYQLPADCTDPDLIQRDISANMRRSVDACLEVGRGLCVLRTACEHGNFLARLDVLGIERRVAQRFMSSARKFSNAATSPLLKAIGTQSKLFEMLVLDDEQIEELELTGQTGELSLDDVATMSVKELRAKVRETLADLEATEAISSEKTKRIEELTKANRRIQSATPDQVLIDLHAESTRITNDARGAVIGNLRQALLAVQQHHDAHGGNSTVFLAGLVGQLAKDLLELRLEFDLPEIDTDEHGWINAQD